MGTIGKFGSEFMTVREAARFANVAKLTIYRRVHAGEIPAVRVGNDGHGPIRIPREPFVRWLYGTPEKEN